MCAPPDEVCSFNSIAFYPQLHAGLPQLICRLSTFDIALGGAKLPQISLGEWITGHACAPHKEQHGPQRDAQVQPQ
jgi:hypothetical protein